jgi:hypothetical protein
MTEGQQQGQPCVVAHQVYRKRRIETGKLRNVKIGKCGNVKIWGGIRTTSIANKVESFFSLRSLRSLRDTIHKMPNPAYPNLPHLIVLIP